MNMPTTPVSATTTTIPTMATERILQLGPGDLALFRDLNRLFGEAFEDPDTYGAAPPDDDWLRGLLAGDQVIALVAVDGDRVTSGLVAYDLPKFEMARREIYIYDLAVAAAHRRQGIATRLIRALCRIAQDRRAWVVYVQADPPDAPAVALYDSLGRREEVFHFDIMPDQAASSTQTGT